MSDGERALETLMTWAKLPAPVLEHVFAQPRKWRFDFAWPDRNVAVEVEGGSYIAGRHSRPGGFEADAEKYNEAAIRGWMVLRVTPHMIEDGRAMSMIERALGSRGEASSG